MHEIQIPTECGAGVASVEEDGEAAADGEGLDQNLVHDIVDDQAVLRSIDRNDSCREK